MDDRLVLLSLEAISDPEKWRRVLQYMMQATGAKAAIITLRDGKNCQIVNDDTFEREYHSPLICGFPLEAIVYYLQELRTIDPWAEAQMTHYPKRPMLMSEVCPPDRVADQRFFSWLKAFGIHDTVVCELDQLPGYWTACNLFLDGMDTARANAVLSYMKEHHEFLQKAWKASQKQIHSQQSGRAALNHLATLEIAACITGPSGKILEANAAFEALVEAKALSSSGPARRAAFPPDAELLGSAKWLRKSIDFNLSSPLHLSVSASAFTPDPLYEGKREELWLVTVRELGKGARSTGCIDLSTLSEQERCLYEAIRSGMSVSDAGTKIGVKRSRAFDIWASVKSQLGIASSHQVR